MRRQATERLHYPHHRFTSRQLPTDLEDWLLTLLRERQLGVKSPVLGDEIKAICQSLARTDARFSNLAKSLPQRLEQIPPENQLRTDFSHKFRTSVAASFTKSLGERLRSDPALVAALEDFEWDLDRLILFAWRGRELKVGLQYFVESLKRQTDWIEDQVAGPPPSL